PPISWSEQKVSEKLSMVSKVSMREMYRMETCRARLITANSRAELDFFSREEERELSLGE
ncbi:MAG: hypothetical protein WBM35_16210, partial [Candidatus Electrothrix sp.]